MAPLTTFTLPLPANGPPAGYDLGEREFSDLSTTTGFNTGIDQRDTFLEHHCCIICGDSIPEVLQHCHIFRDFEPIQTATKWSDLKRRRWIPLQAKELPQHEPRAGLLMCANHRLSFDAHHFFIRFFPDTRKFVFVNYSGFRSLQPFHGKAIALDVRDRYVPFPSLFIIHETRVRGRHPFAPVAPDMPNDIPWQDWILSDGVFDNASGSFNRDSQGNSNSSTSEQLQFQPTTTSAGGASSGERTLPLNAEVIAEILAATRAMPSWKACEMEGKSWTGTAEENIEEYVSSIGIQDDEP